MQDTNLSKYFYGDEAMQFSYFRIPCQLITHPRFKPLSADAKLLYVALGSVPGPWVFSLLPYRELLLFMTKT